MTRKVKMQALSRVTLYNIETGQSKSFHPIDARACLERGGWSAEPPAPVIDLDDLKSQPELPDKPVTAVEPNIEPDPLPGSGKRKAGRPPSRAVD